MTRLFFTILLAAISLGSAWSQRAIDENNGILGWRLGFPMDSVKGVKPDGRQQKLYRHLPLEKPVKMDNITFKRVVLYSFDGKLHSIDIKAEGNEGTKFLRWMKEQYGEGEPINTFGSNIRWEGTKITITLDQNLVTNDVLVSFRDEEVHARYYEYMTKLRYGQ